MVVAQVDQAHVPERRAQVQLDGLAVAGQRRRLDLALGLPPAQPPVKVIAVLGPAVVDGPARVDLAERGDQGLGAFLLGAAVDPRLAALAVRAGRRRVAGDPAAVRQLASARAGSSCVPA